MDARVESGKNSYNMLMTVVVLNGILIGGGSGSLSEKLRYFETLETLSIATRRRRTAGGGYQDSKEIKFQAKTVDESDTETPFFVDPNDFFTGHLAGNESHAVEAHFEDGILSASIQTDNDTFAVEVCVVECGAGAGQRPLCRFVLCLSWPAWRHVEPSDSRKMIVYRASDIRWEGMYRTEKGRRRMFSDGIKLVKGNRERPASHPLDTDRLSGTEGQKRQKRSSHSHHRCSLFLVADYKFTRDIGRTVTETAHYMIGLLTRINARYVQTVWKQGMTGYGFDVQKILIHSNFTTSSQRHYNLQRRYGINEKLDVRRGFDREAGETKLRELRRRPCWLEAERCPSDRGFVVVLLRPSRHNWGAEHDPDTEKCSPSGRDGGKYLMWSYAVEGRDPNNQRLSPCSKVWIAAVLEAKASACFTEKVSGFCGNGKIDEGEECDDAGLFNGHHECCTSQCKLKPGALCRYCCRPVLQNGSVGLCEATEEILRDGRFCGGGYCQDGVCIQSETNAVRRFFSYMQSLGDMDKL
ncbi:hypothetical protein BaRGS_00017934, partial [Batillaria attramentaria]